MKKITKAAEKIIQDLDAYIDSFTKIKGRKPELLIIYRKQYQELIKSKENGILTEYNGIKVRVI